MTKFEENRGRKKKGCEHAWFETSPSFLEYVQYNSQEACTTMHGAIVGLLTALIARVTPL